MKFATILSLALFSVAGTKSDQPNYLQTGEQDLLQNLLKDSDDLEEQKIDKQVNKIDEVVNQIDKQVNKDKKCLVEILAHVLVVVGVVGVIVTAVYCSMTGDKPIDDAIIINAVCLAINFLITYIALFTDEFHQVVDGKFFKFMWSMSLILHIGAWIMMATGFLSMAASALTVGIVITVIINYVVEDRSKSWVLAAAIGITILQLVPCFAAWGILIDSKTRF
jgi:hypothetical protein